MEWFVNIVFGVYKLVGNTYNNLISLANFLATDEIATVILSIRNTIYVLIGIFMLFRIAISLINYLINPDAITDKNIGAGKLIIRIITSIILLISAPLIFNILTLLQSALLASGGLIDNLFTNGGNSSIDYQSMAAVNKNNFDCFYFINKVDNNKTLQIADKVIRFNFNKNGNGSPLYKDKGGAGYEKGDTKWYVQSISGIYSDGSETGSKMTQFNFDLAVIGNAQLNDLSKGICPPLLDTKNLECTDGQCTRVVNNTKEVFFTKPNLFNSNSSITGANGSNFDGMLNNAAENYVTMIDLQNINLNNVTYGEGNWFAWVSGILTLGSAQGTQLTWETLEYIFGVASEEKYESVDISKNALSDVSRDRVFELTYGIDPYSVGASFSRSILRAFANDINIRNSFDEWPTNSQDIAKQINKSGGFETFICLICGVVIFAFFLVIALEIILRNFKLVTLQILSPIPIMAHMNPGDKTLNTFMKQYIGTYLQIFIQLIGIKLAVMILAPLLKTSGSFLYMLGSIMAAVIFMKVAPNFISKALGINDMSGTIGESFKMVKQAAGIGAGAIAGGIAGFVTGFGKGGGFSKVAGGLFSGTMRGIGSGAKGNILGGAKQISARNAQAKHATINGATWFQRTAAGFGIKGTKKTDNLIDESKDRQRTSERNLAEVQKRQSQVGAAERVKSDYKDGVKKHLEANKTSPKVKVTRTDADGNTTTEIMSMSEALAQQKNKAAATAKNYENEMSRLKTQKSDIQEKMNITTDAMEKNTYQDKLREIEFNMRKLEDEKLKSDNATGLEQKLIVEATVDLLQKAGDDGHTKVDTTANYTNKQSGETVEITVIEDYFDNDMSTLRNEVINNANIVDGSENYAGKTIAEINKLIDGRQMEKEQLKAQEIKYNDEIETEKREQTRLQTEDTYIGWKAAEDAKNQK